MEEKTQKKKAEVSPWFGITAIGLSAIALIVAVFASDIAEAIQPTPPAEEHIADFAVRVKDAVIAKLKDKDAIVVANEETHLIWHSLVPKIALGIAVCGIITAAFSYIRKERKQFAIAAAGVGVVAMAWEVMMIGIGALLIIALLYIIVSVLGIDISV